MPQQPSTTSEIRQRMVARIVATSPLTDMAEGGVLSTLVGAVADELAMLDMRAYVNGLSHGFDSIVVGQHLDDRAAQFPNQFPPRRGASAARGGNLSLVRPDTTETLTIAAGQLELGRLDQPNLTYANDAEIFFDVGQSLFPDIAQDPVGLNCRTVGAIGNAPQGAVNVLLSYAGTLTAASNTTAVGGARDGETDADFRRRSLLWLSSLARSQPSGLESLALSFDPTILYASLVEDPSRPGFSRLIIDNGFGMPGTTRNALPRTGIVPTLVAGQRYTFTFDFPAATAPSLKVARGGTTTTYLAGPAAEWIAIEERGILWTNPALVSLDLQPDDEWEISGHLVYKDPIAALQAEVEANGRAAGCRVRVVPARPVYVALSGNIVGLPDYDLADLILRTKRAIVAFGTLIPPGQPLYMHQLHGALRAGVEGLDNIVFDQGDKYPGDPANRIAFSPGIITLR